MNYDIEMLFVEAERFATFSRDTSTKVGAVLLDSDGDAITGGWNDLPTKVIDTPERRERPMKYKFVVHAESNAICRAAHDGNSTHSGTIITTHHPCSDCAKLIIQAGITTVHFDQGKFAGEWSDDLAIAATMLAEAGVTVIERAKKGA